MKNCVFTMWQNDLVALNLWVKYYSQHFDKLLILCFNTKEEYLPKLEKLKEEYDLDYEIVKRFGEHIIDGTPDVALGLIRSKQEQLLRDYNWVLFANVDEILVADKRHGTLKNLMWISNKDTVTLVCEGYEVIQVGEERPIDYSKPYFEQRKYWIKNPNYNKILLSKVPLAWNAGLHQVEGIGDDESRKFKDTGLYLIHLKHADLGAEGRDFGPRIGGLDPNIMKNWRDRKEKIPEYIKKAL